jgi:hypothetical protein
MQNLADNISNVTTNLAKMIKTMGDIASNPAFQAVVALLLLRAGRVDLIAKVFAGAALGAVLTREGKPADREEARLIEQKRMADQLKENKAIKAAVVLRTQENAALKAKTEIDKLKDKFDPSSMKSDMKKQYGKEKGEQVYFAYIRKKSMNKEQADTNVSTPSTAVGDTGRV